MRARASGAPLTGTSLRQREPHPAPAVPAPSGGGPGWGRYPGSARLRRAPHQHQPAPAGASSGTGSSRPQRGRARVGAIPCERAPPARSSPAPACASGSLIRHRQFPPPAGAGQGGGDVMRACASGALTAWHPDWKRAPPARSSPAPACTNGSHIRHRQFPPPAGAGQGGGDTMRACASGTLLTGTSLHQREPHPAPVVPAPAGGGPGWGDTLGAHASGALPTGTSLHRREPHPAPAVPAPSGGGPGWGRYHASARLRRAHRLASRLGARASGALLTSTSLRQREPHPAPAVPAPSGGGVGWGRYPGSARLRRAPHQHQPAPAGASSGTGSSRPQRGRARVGAQRTARRSTTVTCSSPITRANYPCTSLCTANALSTAHQWHT